MPGAKLHVDKEGCIGCGTCVAVCPVGVFEMKEGKSNPSHPEKCTLCMSCVKNCPVSVITVEKKE